MSEREALTIDIGQAGDIVVITLSGRLGMDTYDQFDLTWEKLVEKGMRAAAVDMEAVEFVSSSGLRSLLRFAKQMQPGGSLVVCGLRPEILKVFKYAGFDKILTLADDLGKAKAILGTR